MSGNRLKLYGLLMLLYVLHTDWWLWNDSRQVLGLPVGLLYHLVYMLATAVVMYMLVTQAWPRHLELDDAGEDR